MARTKVVIKSVEGGVVAYIPGKVEKMTDIRETEDEALGALVKHHHEYFNCEITWPVEQKADSTSAP